MWEGKVFADADAADTAETDWKHKVTPERGDLIKQCILLVVASEANAHQTGNHENITTIEDRVVGFLVGSYFIAIMNIRILHAIKIWSCLSTLKNILN